MTLFTLAICTHNRARSLARALSSIAEADHPGVAFEVLAVLNGCTDDSEAVARDAASRLPLRAVNELRPGLSHARNRAIDEAKGEVLVFIDDDAVVDKGFLAAYAAAFGAWPSADVFGGPITPVMEGAPPAWLVRAVPKIGVVYGLRAVEADAPVVATMLPFGCNYAVRMGRQRQHRYDPDLGRAPIGWVRGDEETAVLRAMLSAGATGRWVANARVDHLVPVDRQTAGYVWEYFEGYGRQAILSGGPTRPALLARTVYAYAAYRWARLTAPPEQWVLAMRAAAVRRGQWKGRRDLSRRGAQRAAAAETSR